tara:strand:- start:730 stop:987 length:258 start_codon:yes stop_codon:yes gene_type:complete
MKVRCVFTAYFTDADRRALRAHYGRTGMATRDELKAELEHRGNIQNLAWTDILQPNEEDRLTIEEGVEPARATERPENRRPPWKD